MSFLKPLLPFCSACIFFALSILVISAYIRPKQQNDNDIAPAAATTTTATTITTTTTTTATTTTTTTNTNNDNDNNSNNNCNNNRIQRRNSKIFDNLLTASRTGSNKYAKCPGRNRVQITCNRTLITCNMSCCVPRGTKGQLSY